CSRRARRLLRQPARVRRRTHPLGRAGRVVARGLSRFPLRGGPQVTAPPRRTFGVVALVGDLLVDLLLLPLRLVVSCLAALRRRGTAARARVARRTRGAAEEDPAALRRGPPRAHRVREERLVLDHGARQRAPRTPSRAAGRRPAQALEERSRRAPRPRGSRR